MAKAESKQAVRLKENRTKGVLGRAGKGIRRRPRVRLSPREFAELLPELLVESKGLLHIGAVEPIVRLSTEGR